MPEVSPSESYRTLREQLSSQVLDAGEEGWVTTVPATPDWRVHDVMAHMAGVAADVNAANLDGVGSDAWTNAHIAPRRATPTPDVIEEWAREAGTFETGLDEWPMSAFFMLVADALTHAIDVQCALRLPPDLANHDAATFTISSCVRAMNKRLAAENLLAIAFEGDGVRTGPDDAPVVVTAPDRFELLRGLTGRRTADEIASWRWVGAAPNGYVGFVSRYPMTAVPLGEKPPA